MANENTTEFNGNINCLMRHHQHIESFMRSRNAGDYYLCYMELNNIVGDLVPEMDKKELEEWQKTKEQLRKGFMNNRPGANIFGIPVRDRKIQKYNFLNTLSDTFEYYMLMSKSKGMLQRNTKSTEDVFLE